MIKILLRVCLVLFLVSLATSCGGGSGADGGAENPNPDVRDAIQAMLAEEWSAFQQKWSFSQGGVAVRLITPSGDYFTSVGMGENVRSNIHFRGASTTKTFTAASIMLMHQQGLLNIDHAVDAFIPGTTKTYLPNTPDYAVPYKSRITIRQLLEHRAGVFDVTNSPVPPNVDAPYAGMFYLDYVMDTLDQPEHTFTFDELVGVVARHGLSYWPPGGGYHYSNIGYAMLGKIIERISGMSYAQYVRKTFVVPLGLRNTTFPDLGSDTSLPSPYAEGFTVFQGETYETTAKNPSHSVAEGNILTTPRDLSLWINLLLSGRAGLRPDVAAMMMDVSATGEHHVWYGLGITFTEGLGFGHNGGQAGYMTVMRHDPASEVSVVIFSSVIVADDIYSQVDFLIDAARKAKRLAGY